MVIVCTAETSAIVMKTPIERQPMQVTRIMFGLAMTFLLALLGCDSSVGQERRSDGGPKGERSNPYYSTTDTARLDIPLEEWERILDAHLYHVAFEKGTERPFTGKFKKDGLDGTYRCAVCGNALFDPRTKFESGTGWPSFYRPIPARVKDQMDLGHGMVRTEVLCQRCGAHLGHVFEDGPEPTGLRYCINAISLDHTSTSP